MRIATERLYRTADGRVVHEGDPDAAFLLAPVGGPIPEGFVLPDDVETEEVNGEELTGNDHEQKDVAAPDAVKSDDPADPGGEGDPQPTPENSDDDELTPAQKAAATRATKAPAKAVAKKAVATKAPARKR